MIELLAIIIAVLLVVLLIQQQSLRSVKVKADSAKTRADDAQMQSVELAERLAGISTLNATEIMEAMVEQNTKTTVESDIWSIEMSYGKWEPMDDGSGRPPPEIRGYWPSCPGKLIGVRMPKGSEYDMHSHPWVEILIGMSGVVWVEIEADGGEITRHRLGPEDVVIIPAGARHAVAKAESEAVLTCIWGVPKTT